MYKTSTLYTEYCIHHVLCHPKMHCLPLQASIIMLQTVSHSNLLMNRVYAPIWPRFQTNASRLTATQYFFILGQLWPQSASIHSLDHGLPVHHQSCWLTAFKYIFKLCWPQPSIVNLNLHHFRLQVRPITTSSCISQLGQSPLRSLSPNLFICGFQTASKFAWSVSPSWHDHSLKVCLHTLLTMGSKHISKLTQSWAPIVSPNSLD
jgi:hypothetical protein